MDLETRITEKLKRLEGINQELRQIGQQMGGLQERQRAMYNAGLEIKGQVDALRELKAEEDEGLARSKTAGLTLPEGVKPIIPEAPVAEEKPAETAPVTDAIKLEVQ